MVGQLHHRRLHFRSSGASWVPTDVAGCVLWLDASYAASITSSLGLVSAWADRSTAGNNVTQSEDANKPTTGATTQNGLNVLDFDGGDRMLSATLSAGFFDVTVLAVAKLTTGAATRAILCRDTGAGNRHFQARVSDGRIQLQFITPTADATSSGQYYNAWHCWGYTAKYTAPNTALTCRINAGEVATASVSGQDEAGTALFSVGDYGGSAHIYWLGSIAEVIVYNSHIGAVNLAAAESYLKAKWGTP